MLAIVDAEMSTSPRAPRCSRSADTGAFVSVNGTCTASLMRASPSSGRCRLARPGRCGYVFSTDHARVTVNSQQLWSPPLTSAFQFVRNVPDESAGTQEPARVPGGVFALAGAEPIGAGL